MIASILFAAAGAATFVDLGQPGALQRLAVENPDHYVVVRNAMDAARHIGCDGAARIFKAATPDSALACRDSQIMTRFPPKKRVNVRVDATTYSVNVPLTVRPPTLER